MAKDNGVIGVQEKRELSKLIDAEFSEIIQSMKQEIKYTEGEILEEAQKKFGIEALNKEIEHLKEKITFIEQRKTDLGFSGDSFQTRYPKNGGFGQEIDPNTKAGRYYYMKVARSIDIRQLENQRSDRLKKLWLMDQRTDVSELVAQKVDLKLLPKPAKEK